MTVSGRYDTEMRISVRLDATGHGHAFDGATDSVILRDVSLHVPFAPDIAKYMMGFGRHGRRLAIHEAVGLPLIWHWEEGSGAHMARHGWPNATASAAPCPTERVRRSAAPLLRCSLCLWSRCG